MTQQIEISRGRPGDGMRAHSTAEGVRMPGGHQPYYVAAGREVEVFEACHQRGLPVMLKGPTGCGKTRFLEYMSFRLGARRSGRCRHRGCRRPGLCGSSGWWRTERP